MGLLGVKEILVERQDCCKVSRSEQLISNDPLTQYQIIQVVSK